MNQEKKGKFIAGARNLMSFIFGKEQKAREINGLAENDYPPTNKN